ncbi:MAG: hypothetical protein ACRDJN_26670, partial [Chloroflexota bacterium]
HVFRGRALQSAAVDGEPVPVTPQTLEGRPQVLLAADYAAGQSRRWRLVWGAAQGAALEPRTELGGAVVTSRRAP